MGHTNEWCGIRVVYLFCEKLNGILNELKKLGISVKLDNRDSYKPGFKFAEWELKGVPGRSEAKFHASNYWYQLEGCIALGLRYKNLNSDNYRDLTNSADTLSAFHVALKDYNRVKLYITAEPNIK